MSGKEMTSFGRAQRESWTAKRGGERWQCDRSGHGESPQPLIAGKLKAARTMMTGRRVLAAECVPQGDLRRWAMLGVDLSVLGDAQASA